MDDTFDDRQAGLDRTKVAVTSIAKNAIARSPFMGAVCDHIDRADVCTTFKGSAMAFHLGTCDLATLLVGDVDQIHRDPGDHCNHPLRKGVGNECQKPPVFKIESQRASEKCANRHHDLASYRLVTDTSFVKGERSGLQ